MHGSPQAEDRGASSGPVSRLQDGPVLVIGPGAIGAVVAARIAQSGIPVITACRTEATAQHIRAQGVAAKGLRRDDAVLVDAITSPDDLEAEPAAAVLATKCQDAPDALATWLPSLPDCPIVAMQNGLQEDELIPLAPKQVMACCVTFPATLMGPGQSAVTGPGGFVIGPWPTRELAMAGQRADYAGVATLLARAMPTRVSGNMLGIKWTKLLVNSCITTLGAVSNTTLGELLADKTARQLFLAVTTEGYRAGLADGVRFEPVNGFRPDRVALAPRTGFAGQQLRHLFLQLVGAKYRRHRSSSLQSLERGARTEVDYLNQVIVETARRRGLDAPVNAALVEMVHQVEAGTRTAELANLKEAAQALSR